jgi:hypothetical protein
MKKIDFTKTGGMPLTQDLLKFMQDANKETCDALVAALGDNIIISGSELQNDGSYSDGLVIVGGELMPSVGGGSFAWVERHQSYLQFETGGSKNVLLSQICHFSNSPSDMYRDFVRLKTLKDMKNELDVLNSMNLPDKLKDVGVVLRQYYAAGGKVNFLVTKEVGDRVRIVGRTLLQTEDFLNGNSAYYLDNLPCILSRGGGVYSQSCTIVFIGENGAITGRAVGNVTSSLVNENTLNFYAAGMSDGSTGTGACVAIFDCIFPIQPY